MAKARLTVTIDETLDSQLTEYSESTLIAKSKIVNIAIQEYLNNHK